MNIFLCIYNLLFLFLFFFTFPIFWFLGKYSGMNNNELMQRLGVYSSKILNKRIKYPKLWIHASSIGEVKVAYRIIDVLINKFKNISVIVSTCTMSGNQHAMKLNYKNVTVIYAPIDLYFCVNNALMKIKPNIMVYIETEIWPNWISIAKKLDISTIFVNGRISKRSFKKYKKIKSFMKFILNKVDAFSMVSEEDKLRVLNMGAPQKNVFVNGNVKFDVEKKNYNDNIYKQMFNSYNFFRNQPVFIAGSVRRFEESIIIDSYVEIRKFFPNIILIIAPRHLNRVKYIEKLFNSKGIQFIRRSNLVCDLAIKERIIILDTIGELTNFYSLATVVFCGASLIDLGGQNIIEAACWGKPVIHGPFMDDFKEIVDLLQKHNASIKVKSGKELTTVIIHLLNNEKYANRIGSLAKELVLNNSGSCLQHVKIIGGFIEKFEQNI